MALQLCAQPVGGRAGVALRQVRLCIRHRGLQRLPQAAGIHIAQRVGREITEHADRPVHILQHAVGRGVDGHAEVLQEAGVPGLFQVVERQLAGHEPALQVETQHHMQVVVHLVRFGADIPWLHPVHRGVEVFGVAQVSRFEAALHALEQQAGECAGAAELVLADAALALVHTRRHAVPQGRETMGRVYAQFVQRVAHLVDRRIEAVEGF
jgi:hypothetical protein